MTTEGAVPKPTRASAPGSQSIRRKGNGEIRSRFWTYRRRLRYWAATMAKPWSVTRSCQIRLADSPCSSLAWITSRSGSQALDWMELVTSCDLGGAPGCSWPDQQSIAPHRLLGRSQSPGAIQHQEWAAPMPMLPRR